MPTSFDPRSGKRHRKTQKAFPIHRCRPCRSHPPPAVWPRLLSARRTPFRPRQARRPRASRSDILKLWQSDLPQVVLFLRSVQDAAVFPVLLLLWKTRPIFCISFFPKPFQVPNFCRPTRPTHLQVRQHYTPPPSYLATPFQALRYVGRPY